MVWVDSWETFFQQAEKLYLENPDHVRALSCRFGRRLLTQRCAV